MIDKFKLKKILNDSFNSSLKFTNIDNFKDSNSLKSSKFVSIIAQELINELFNNNYNLNVIEVDDKGGKYPGEWLLDITITENINDFNKKIILALESESDTSEKAFNDDFAKLINTKADNYMYLNGVNQKTIQGKQEYINSRLSYAKTFLNSIEFPSFFIGFWTSPKKINGYNSIWSAITDGEFNHLKATHLYEYLNSEFYEVN
ncbi:MAG: hypothetical protein WAR79_01025 [Melioribacteraceae bacterium]